jgi:hypothetical protein
VADPGAVTPTGRPLRSLGVLDFVPILRIDDQWRARQVREGDNEPELLPLLLRLDHVVDGVGGDLGGAADQRGACHRAPLEVLEIHVQPFLREVAQSLGQIYLDVDRPSGGRANAEIHLLLLRRPGDLLGDKDDGQDQCDP